MTEKVKKPYRKPLITKVRLVPEEAVLGGCKNVGTVGANSTANCGIGGTPCNVLGS